MFLMEDLQNINPKLWKPAEPGNAEGIENHADHCRGDKNGGRFLPDPAQIVVGRSGLLFVLHISAFMDGIGRRSRHPIGIFS